MLGVDDYVVSNSTPGQSLDFLPAKKSWKIIFMGVTVIQPSLFVWELHKGGKIFMLLYINFNVHENNNHLQDPLTQIWCLQCFMFMFGNICSNFKKYPSCS